MTAKKVTLADGVDLYCGDCLQLLPGMTADHVITDPPYEKHMHERGDGKRRFRKDGGKQVHDLGFAPVEAIRDDAAKLMIAASKGWLLVFCTPEGVAPWRDAIEAAGARYKRACAWIKPDSAPQMNGQGPAHGFENFVTAWCAPGFSKWNGGGKRGVYTHLTNNKQRQGEHPTEKPVTLMAELIRDFTNPGDTILDPFMGSGTTGVAAVRAGRKFIGIELDPKWFALSQKRIGKAMNQGDLFVHMPAPPGRAKQTSLDFSA